MLLPRGQGVSAPDLHSARRSGIVIDMSTFAPHTKSPEAYCLVCGHALHMPSGSMLDAEKRARYAGKRHVLAFGHKVELVGFAR